jgi:hypothetical protein
MNKEDFLEKLLHYNFILLEAKSQKDIDYIRGLISKLIKDYSEDKKINNFIETGVYGDIDFLY